jgi:hypothetical protein
MNTDTLIRALAASHEPAPKARIGARVVLALAVGLVAGLIMLQVTLGLRPDIGTAAWAAGLKALFGAVVASAAFGAAVRFARPVTGGRYLLPLAVIALVSLAVTAIALASEMPQHRLAAWTGGGVPWCVVLIPVFSIPAALGLVWALKDAAPTRLTLAGAAIGALAGSIGTIVYAGFCPVDSVAFVTTWYVAGIAVSSAIGALLGRAILRW